MAIPSVVGGLVEAEDGKVFELDSPKGLTWLKSVTSFRYEPTGANKPYTVRKEPKKGGDYWYGYRKVAGKLHKRYMGRDVELSTAKLEEIAEALNTSQQLSVTQVTDTVTQVTELNNQQVTQTITDKHVDERVTALELQFQVLQESLEDLRSMLLGKSEGLSNSSELLNPNRVTDKELQKELSNLSRELQDENQRLLIELGNLTAENQKVRADYAALLESSTAVTNKLRQEVQELRSQLEAQKTNWDELREELEDSEESCAKLRSQLEKERISREPIETELAKLAADREELAQLKKWAKEAAAELHREENSMKLEKVRWQRELSDARAELADAKATMLNQSNKIRELERGFSFKPNPAESRLRLEIGELQAQLSDLKQKSAAASKDSPEAADLLNQLKAKRKKSKADLADLEVILEILES